MRKERAVIVSIFGKICPKSKIFLLFLFNNYIILFLFATSNISAEGGAFSGEVAQLLFALFPIIEFKSSVY
jgi:hypothetical protein